MGTADISPYIEALLAVLSFSSGRQEQIRIRLKFLTNVSECVPVPDAELPEHKEST